MIDMHRHAYRPGRHPYEHATLPIGAAGTLHHVDVLASGSHEGGLVSAAVLDGNVLRSVRATYIPGQGVGQFTIRFDEPLEVSTESVIRMERYGDGIAVVVDQHNTRGERLTVFDVGVLRRIVAGPVMRSLPRPEIHSVRLDIAQAQQFPVRAIALAAEKAGRPTPASKTEDQK